MFLVAFLIVIERIIAALRLILDDLDIAKIDRRSQPLLLYDIDRAVGAKTSERILDD